MEQPRRPKIYYFLVKRACSPLFFFSLKFKVLLVICILNAMGYVVMSTSKNYCQRCVPCKQTLWPDLSSQLWWAYTGHKSKYKSNKVAIRYPKTANLWSLSLPSVVLKKNTGHPTDLTWFLRPLKLDLKCPKTHDNLLTYNLHCRYTKIWFYQQSW